MCGLVRGPHGCGMECSEVDEDFGERTELERTSTEKPLKGFCVYMCIHKARGEGEPGYLRQSGICVRWRETNQIM